MSIQINNNPTTVTIVNGANSRTINKNLIREVSILKNTTLKIDIGGGALRNIFLPIADITVPDHADAADLLDKANQMLVPQDVAILNNIGAIAQDVDDIQLKLAGLLPANLQQPILVDDSNPNVIYSGYAVIGSKANENKWAIMRTVLENDVQHNQWVNNHQLANYVWDSRLDYQYA
jgi:hypothetical protein